LRLYFVAYTLSQCRLSRLRTGKKFLEVMKVEAIIKCQYTRIKKKI